MQHINLSFFVELGAALNAFISRGKVPKTSLADAYSTVSDLIDRLNKLLNGIPIRLETASISARELQLPVQELFSRHFLSNGEDQN